MPVPEAGQVSGVIALPLLCAAGHTVQSGFIVGGYEYQSKEVYVCILMHIYFIVYIIYIRMHVI